MLIPSIAIALFTRILRDKGYAVDLFETTYYVSDQKSTSESRMELFQARSFNITEEIGITMKTDLLGDFRKKVEEYKPDFMIFSVVEDAFAQCVELLGAVEDLNIPHLIGGVFPTNDAARALSFPQVKTVGRGEGEQIVLDVAEAVRTGASFENIAGIWYKDGDGTIHRNHQPPLVNLDAVRPDFGLFDPRRFYRPMGGKMFKMIPVESYRGCPYACTFCNSPAQRSFTKSEGLGNFLRRKSLPVLRDELREYVDRFDPTFFYFMDDSFLARPHKEILEFCDMYEEFKVPFWFNTRAENLDVPTLKRLKDVGCYRMASSVECGNEEYRNKVLKRKITNEEIIRRFRLILESGIAFSLDVMVGLPGETRDLVMDSIKLVRSIQGYDALTVSIFTPYHGTTLRDVAIRNGWLDKDFICTQGHSASVLEMPAPMLSQDEISSLTTLFPLYCYFPENEWGDLRRAEAMDDEGARLRKHYGEIYARDFLGMDQDEKFARTVASFGGGGTGCRTNPKDEFRVSPSRLSADEMEALM
ncbi:radical SAM protein [Magnetospira sp. QH-2]|uniref:B12-binding domain-containing radical SAM protein n=1 Tax=Magnetospira sp. (strain QH-2) TaxID=1288970 RepID=UPI00130D5DAC|nr:radical SAM protein [Magnetospira sp. QH-2]